MIADTASAEVFLKNYHQFISLPLYNKKMMTKEQAKEIAERFQAEALRHKSGHYHYGYITLSYNPQEQLFEIRREDMSFNMYEPTISCTHHTKEDFIEYLRQYHKFSDFQDT